MKTENKIQVVIVEDDPYARDWMALLLARDWRTRVAAEFETSDAPGWRSYLADPLNPADVLIVDTEIPAQPQGYRAVAESALARPHPPRLLYTCTRPEAHSLGWALQPGGAGYLVKGELRYGVASAAAYAAQGAFVLTPGGRELAGRLEQLGLACLPRPAFSLDGQAANDRFTHRERDLARLGVLFNLAQRDLADELILSADFVAEVLGQVYEKLGLRDLRAGEQTLESLFADPALAARMRAVLPPADPAHSGPRPRKLPSLATLAFHLLTAPEIEKLS